MTTNSLATASLAGVTTPVHPPDNMIVTKNGDYITSVDGKWILTINGFIPL